MKIICEMELIDFFKLSMGQIAFIGRMNPNVEYYIPQCKANLYVDEEKIATIDLIGEDMFAGGDIEARKDKRAVRTTFEIDLQPYFLNKQEVKLVIYNDG